MRAAEVAKALGGSVGWRGAGNYEAPCPLASHGRGRGDRNHSLSLRDGDKGLLVNCHGGCNPRDVLAEIRRRGIIGFSDNPITAARSPKPQRDLGDYARELWHEARKIEGTIAERYLRESRGISVRLPPSLRFHPRVKVPRERLWLPAMVAAVSGEDHKVLAVQVTWLDPSTANKANVKPVRRTFGALDRGAVRLGPADVELGLAEGTETALSAEELSGVTTWAVLGAARLDLVQIPDCVRTVHIFADADEAGWMKAEIAAGRLARNYLVRKRWAPQGHKDWNDALKAQRAAA